MTLLGVFFVWALFGFVAGIVATKKGRSGCGWFVLGLVFGPLALLFAAVMSTDYRALDAENERQAAYREMSPVDRIKNDPFYRNMLCALGLFVVALWLFG